MNENLEKIIESGVLKEKKWIAVDLNPKKRFLIEGMSGQFFLPSSFSKAYMDWRDKKLITYDNAIVVITATMHSNNIISELLKINCDYIIFDPYVSLEH